jgi:hypothetical protein
LTFYEEIQINQVGWLDKKDKTGRQILKPHAYSNPSAEGILSIDKGRRLPVLRRSCGNHRRATLDDISATMDWMHTLRTVEATKDYELKVKFSDILGNRYVQTIKVGKSGINPALVIEDKSLIPPVSPELPPRPGEFTESPLKYIHRRVPPLERR